MKIHEGSPVQTCGRTGEAAKTKITDVEEDVLKLQEGTNCKFMRDRVIRINSHLCYGAIDGLSSVSLAFLYRALNRCAALATGLMATRHALSTR